jgi:hypothetical protein
LIIGNWPPEEIMIKPPPRMNSLIFAGLAIAAVMLRPEAALAETWCIRDKTATTPGVCGFSSALDCVHAAMVGPPQSICERERWKPDKPDVNRPPAARRQQSYP